MTGPGAEQSPDDDMTLWVRSSLAADGNYVVLLHVGDRSWQLDPQRAIMHALTVIRATNIADHDAATYRMLLGVGCMPDSARFSLQVLRAARPPVPDEQTQPLTVTPGVSRDDLIPFLAVMLDNRDLGQWTVTDALDHAHAVLDAATSVSLDASLRQYLETDIGLDPATARAAVAGLNRHLK